MFRPMLAFSVLTAALAAPALAQDAQPSFDCVKASTPIEHAVCADAILAKADADLAGIYTEALAQAIDPDSLRSSQRAWSNERAAACGILPGADDDVPDFSSAQLTCLLELYTARMAELGAPNAALGNAPDPGQILNGMWQLAEIIEAQDEALKSSGQQGRLIRLNRHGLNTLNGAGCAGPTLQPLAEARARPLDADEQALIAKLDATGVDATGVDAAGADAAASNGKVGIAGFCLGRLFALYLPADDGSLLVADGGGVYRLQRLSTKVP